jgi:hypothetical protein
MKSSKKNSKEKTSYSDHKSQVSSAIEPLINHKKYSEIKVNKKHKEEPKVKINPPAIIPYYIHLIK